MIPGQASISLNSQNRTTAAANNVLSAQQQYGHASRSLFQTPIQYKLSIGSQDDPLEKEADDMADKVMRMEMPQPINFSSANNIVNRKCAHCEEEEKQLQRKENN